MPADLIQEASYQHVPMGFKANGDGSFALMVSSVAGDGGGSTEALDREIVFITYRVKTAFTGASVGDTVTQMRVVNLSGASPVIESNTWYNDSTATALASAPLVANIEPLATGGITNAQMVAALSGIATAALQTTGNTAITAMSAKLPATLGIKTAALSLSVAPASDANQARETYATVTIMVANAAAAAALFTGQACSALDLVNGSAVDIEYQRGASGLFMIVPAGTSRLVQGITNANQIGVRRVDLNATAVVVRAEAFAV